MAAVDITALFEQRKAGKGCPMCPDSGAGIVAELPSGFVHLQDDADYRGYCILVFKRHDIELYSLTPAERADWIEDIARIGAAISTTCAPAKLNVSMLGNLCPHLHCHIMPRYVGDPEWGGPPLYRSAEQRRPLAPADYAELIKSLKSRLT